MYKVGIITASDKGSIGEREDLSGKIIKDIVTKYGYTVVEYVVLADNINDIYSKLIEMSDLKKVDLILTTGGTGFSQRDNTPEATKKAILREAPGICEAIRSFSLSITPRAMLSRAVSGIRNKTLIVNLPGSPKAVKESLDYALSSINHGLEILTGDASECAR